MRSFQCRGAVLGTWYYHRASALNGYVVVQAKTKNKTKLQIVKSLNKLARVVGTGEIE